MKHLLTRQAARLLSDLEGRGDLESYYSSQLRDFVQRKLVAPAGFQGQGQKAALYGVDELCVARLLSLLTRLGLRSDQVEQALRLLTNATTSDGKSAPGRRRTGGIPQAVKEGAAAGEVWWFKLDVAAVPRGMAAGDEVRGGFYQGTPGEHHPLGAHFPPVEQIGGIADASILVPVTGLFAPIVNNPELATGPVDEDDPDEDEPTSVAA